MKSYRIFVTLLILTFFLNEYNSINGQEIATVLDSVFIPQGYLLVSDDTIQRFDGDTTLLLPKDADYKVKKDKEYHSAAFYSNLKDKSHDGKLTKGLYSATIREQRDTTVAPTDLATKNYHPEQADKIIRNIEFLSVDLIDGSVKNLSSESTSAFAQTLNSMHVDTREPIVRKNLTIKEGDKLTPYSISDNEYLLRKLRYIEDSKIYIIADSLNPDTVDLLVVTKDIFPLALGFSMGALNDFTIDVNNYNIFGIGHEFSNKFRVNGNADPALAYNGKLAFRNLWGSFVDTRLECRFNSKEDLYRLTIEREFITPETKYGGGIELSKRHAYEDIKIDDSTSIIVPYTKNYLDQWLGRVIILDDLSRTSIALKGRYMATRYVQRPLVEADTNQQFFNINLLLGSVTLFKKNHFKERMLLGYGMVEDIDYGFAIEITGGYQFSEYFKAPYAGISVKAAHKFSVGFIAGGVEFGGHNYQNTFAQGLFRAGFTYYTPLFKIGQMDYRFLSRWFYTEGVRHYGYDILNLGKEVRGISNAGVEGNKRLIARFELVSFLRGNLIGFRFSPNLFYDAAFLGYGSSVISSKNFYSGIGAGVRIRNEHLALQTIILRFAYYPDNPVKDGHFGGGVGASVPDVFKEYDIVKPDILKY